MTSTPAPVHPTLAAMLRASEKLEREGQSPLAEVDPHSLDEFWQRINSKLITGMPEAITDDDRDIMAMTLRLRAERMEWTDKSERKRQTRAKNAASTARSTPTAEQIASAPSLDLDCI